MEAQLWRPFLYRTSVRVMPPSDDSKAKDFDKRLEARRYAREFGADLPEVNDWIWPDAREVVDEIAVDAVAATGGDNE